MQELRGRNASVLGEKIREQSVLDEETRKFALAQRYEALLRELIEKGHVPQAKAKANEYNGVKSNFDYSGPLTETMLLDCVAVRVGSGTKPAWKSVNMKTDNDLPNRIYPA